jgi:ribosomal protein S12 methylthiotransferase
MMAESKGRASVQIINLGCAKNVVDSEEMLGVLADNGYRIGADGKEADVVIINTCGFIESAKQESIDVILEALERKSAGQVQRVVVAGCLAQRYSQQLQRELPDVDAFLGTGQMQEIAEIVHRTMTSSSPLIQVPEKPHHRWVDVPTRVLSTAPWTAYLKISEGCDHQCTFCAIPSFRGRHVSKPLDRILEEASALTRQGVKELNLIAQDSTQYGYDLYRKPMLPTLLRELSQIERVHWIRLFYCYPSRVKAEVIEAIATTPRVCQYIDMPLQHADDEVLGWMRRPLSGSAYLRILERFREASPDMAIRTTFIVGFPGETETHFQNLMDFVERAQFDRVGVFAYSVEDGTLSASLPGRVPAKIKRLRKDRLMQLQQGISLERNRRWIGREMEVLVEGIVQSAWASVKNGRSYESGENRQQMRKTPLRAASHANALCVGRSFRDAPEIDGLVYVQSDSAKPGDILTARITDAQHYDLLGVEIKADNTV